MIPTKFMLVFSGVKLSPTFFFLFKYIFNTEIHLYYRTDGVLETIASSCVLDWQDMPVCLFWTIRPDKIPSNVRDVREW